MKIVGNRGYPWVTPRYTLKGGGIIFPRLHNHGDPSPECPENPESLGDHTVSHQDIETPVPVQGVVPLLEVQEDLTENRLPHVC